jgi:hypothetical protein
MRYTCASQDDEGDFTPTEIRKRMGHTSTSTFFEAYARDNIAGIDDDEPVIMGYKYDSPGRLCRNTQLEKTDVIPEGPGLHLSAAESELLRDTLRKTCEYLAGDDAAGEQLMEFFATTPQQQLLEGIPLGRQVQFRISPHWKAVGAPRELVTLDELPLGKQLFVQCPPVQLPAGCQPLDLNSIPSNALIWTDWRQLEGVVFAGAAVVAAAPVGAGGGDGAPGPSNRVQPQLPTTTVIMQVEERITSLSKALGNTEPGTERSMILQLLCQEKEELARLVSVCENSQPTRGW